MAPNATGEDLFPKKIYAPTALPGDVSLGIDAEGRHVNLAYSDERACIGIMGMTGTGKSVVLQSVIEQYARGGAEVLYCGLKGIAPGTVDTTPNVVFVADGVDSTVAAIDHVAGVIERRECVFTMTRSHRVVLVIDHVDTLVRALSGTERARDVYDSIDYIIDHGTENDVVLILTSQTLKDLPTTRSASRGQVFGSVVVSGGRTGDTIPFPGAQTASQRLPIGRCVYFTESGGTEFQAFMPSGETSTIKQRHVPLARHSVLVPDVD